MGFVQTKQLNAEEKQKHYNTSAVGGVFAALSFKRIG